MGAIPLAERCRRTAPSSASSCLTARLSYATSVLDLLGGIGVLLPTVTRVAPGLTVLAALGCAALQASAVVFHVSRGEAADTPFNVLLAALALVVAWGRRKAPDPYSTSKASLT